MTGHIPSCGIDSCGDGLPCDCPCHERVEDRVKRHLQTLTPDQRVEFLQSIGETFCLHCGEERHGRTCHCTNDE